jgi:hypothetical protein
MSCPLPQIAVSSMEATGSGDDGLEASRFGNNNLVRAGSEDGGLVGGRSERRSSANGDAPLRRGGKGL